MALLMSVFRISEPFLFRLNFEGNRVFGNKFLKVSTIDIELSSVDSVVFNYHAQKLDFKYSLQIEYLQLWIGCILIWT